MRFAWRDAIKRLSGRSFAAAMRSNGCQGARSPDSDQTGCRVCSFARRAIRSNGCQVCSARLACVIKRLSGALFA